MAISNRGWRAIAWILACVVSSVYCPAHASDLEIARQISIAQVPLERLEPNLHAKVTHVLQPSALFVQGPVESFPCRPNVYHELLDNPEYVIHCWRVLGACKATITRGAEGSFVGKDNLGSEISWQPVSSDKGRRIWYVEGKGRPGPLLPMVHLKAVVLLRFQVVQGDDGRVGVRHRVDMFAQCESKALAFISKICGLTVEAAGNKVLDQVGLFYSGMAWYLTEHPRWGHQTLQKQAEQNGEPERIKGLLAELALSAAERPDKPVRKRP